MLLETLAALMKLLFTFSEKFQSMNLAIKMTHFTSSAQGGSDKSTMPKKGRNT